ncbi:MAG: UbiD family decarboxylase [Chloroflexi bacterium]|nr:UbiD family decarboxylase [Chloroflexota bacterium]
MTYRDLREYIARLDEVGELTRLDGVDWNEEVGAVYYLSSRPVLIDNISGYPPGYKILVGVFPRSPRQFFLATNWSTTSRGTALTREWKEHQRTFHRTPPVEVRDGPVLENVITGEGIDLFKFPVPKWHEEDGGRYIGTHDMLIVKDPETGRLNVGTYRMQVHDRCTLGIYISAGKDGYIIVDRYLSQGKACPVVAVFSVDPAQLLASSGHIPHFDQTSEFDFAGWLKGSPEEVLRGPVTGLPIPARAEIAVEGEIAPGEKMLEGPFGEGTGYSEARMSPVIKVKAIYHRHAPILTGAMPIYHPPDKAAPQDIIKSSQVWDQMERAGVREIKGVACFYQNRLIVVAIKNSYAGHSRQAGLIASQCHAGAYCGHWVVVVDDDIDPSNLVHVMWQVVTRTDGGRAIQVLDYCWGSHMSALDPTRAATMSEYPLNPSEATYRSAVVVDACRPLEWDRSWHRQVKPSDGLQQRVIEKWGQTLFPGGDKGAYTGTASMIAAEEGAGSE